MAHVVIGIPGDPQLYLADTQAGTVTPLAPQAQSALHAADQLRQSGATIVKGVNLAVAVGGAEKAASGVFDG
ncbi:hypothetical protein [Rhizobium leucaenae]|jgi:hypothetical protein|uniref:Uncharacterized protein n=1 Tax=Rhizobium leucaenae TaxID=29450 RepID=A0A7W6ZSU9_9HYPH|nr:hypothetical protein [Rhizobium leucaenae]MBB4567994.1 hypothetical protein [Rhizobium leucaenae]MBB6301259.1 hypothetical protein [Rhizobium leucaenae]